MRFRHKRGFGVHSPFMFNLILYVIRDKEKKYVYPAAAETRNIPYRERKLCRLLFRLTTYLEAKTMVCLGRNCENVEAYLSERMQVTTNSREDIGKADFIYIDKDARFLWRDPAFLPLPVSGRRCMVITDIYKNSFNARLWQQWRRTAQVSVDMMWYGLLIFDEKLQKGKYNLII